MARTESRSATRRQKPAPPAHAARELSSAERSVQRRLTKSDFVYDVEVAYGSTRHLTRVGVRPPLGDYLRELWQRRHFIWRESRSKVATGNAGDRLGIAWLVIRPLLDALFYWVIFGLVLNMSRGMENYIAFVIIGVFMFQLTSVSFTSGASAIRQNRSMIKAFSFPRASIPLAMLVRNFLERVPAMIVMLIIIMAVPPHEMPGWSWLAFPLVLALHCILNFGVMLLFARIGSALPDLSHAMAFVTRILLYSSAVIFPIDRFVSHPTALAIVQANPVYIVLDAYRTLLITGVMPGPMTWISLSAWAFGLLLVGFWAFWAGEETYARER